MPSPLTIQAELPLAWHPQYPAHGSDGVLLLRVLSLMEAAPPHFDDEDSIENLRWQAMEVRLDLCLQLLGQLLLRDGPLPRNSMISLSGEGASWLTDTAMAPQEEGVLALYLSPRIPQPLLLPARVSTVEALAAGRWRIEVQFRLGDAELQDWLDKTIFRRHRREIYERKHADYR